MESFLRGGSFILMYGVSYGVVLFLLSIGLALTLGLMRVVNLAHGAFAAIGGYAALALMNFAGLDFISAALIAAVGVGLGSIAVERTLYVKLYDANELDQVLMTVGLLFLTTATLNLVFGPDIFSGRLPAWLTANVDLGVRPFQSYRIAVLMCGLVLMAALWLMFERTRLGARLRAAVDNRAMAQVMGIDVARLFVIVFAIGSGLAALGGAVGFPILPLEPRYPFKYLTLVLIIVSLAGHDDIKAAAPAAIAVGLIDTAARFLWPAVGAFAVYAWFIVVMAWRSGGDEQRRHEIDFATPRHDFRAMEWAFWAALLGFFFVFEDYLSLATGALVMALFVLSLDLVLGFAGIVTLGHGVFFGLGAYVAAWMALAGWREPITCAVAAGVAAALAACVLGPLVLRKRGMPLIMITFVLALIFHEAANKASDWTGGDNGLTGFTFAPLFGRFGWSVYSRAEYLYVLGWLFLLLFACKRIVASPFGLALQGVRENAARMPLLGASVRGHLLRVYAVSAFMAGVAGALLTQTTKFVGLSALSVDVSIDALVMLTLGGVGALYGAIVGAGVYVAIHHFASEWNPYHWMFVIGFLLLAVVMFGRGGLLRLGRSALRFVNARAKGGRP